jgi:isopentenyl-diphosphate delta-isomerase
VSCGAAGNSASAAKTAPASALRDIGLHEKIIAFDTQGEQYPIDKLEAHQHNVPHMAISIFVFDGEHLLIQQRAETKYHSAGLWANTVCSHPRWDETAGNCATRRLNEELGCATELTAFGNINYAAQVGELYENEQVHCFYGQLKSRREADDFNPIEVAAIDWLTIPQIIDKINQHPDIFTEWFKIYMTTHRDMINAVIQKASERSL